MMGVGLALISATALAQSKPGWQATFPKEHVQISLESAGAYTGGLVTVNLDSLGANMMEPNTTGKWTVVPNLKEPAKGQLIYRDPVPGLKMRGPTEVPERKNGTLAAMATVNHVLGPTKATATVNVTGGPDGKGSVSRQGPMVRWNGATQFMTCFVDFSEGTTYLWAGRSAIEYQPLGKAIPIKGFANTKPYRVELTMIGPVARCQVFDGKDLVADTGDFKDDATPPKGVAGVLVEITPTKPEQALEGSFSEFSAVTP
jgi:hypothetical protein